MLAVSELQYLLATSRRKSSSIARWPTFMASGRGQAAGLGEKDLGTLHSALYPARSSYKSFAIQIGVKIGEINNIEGKYADHSDRLLQILSVRLKKAEPLTWSDMDTALRLDCVGESRTADSIRKKYIAEESKEGSDEAVRKRVERKKDRKKEHNVEVASPRSFREEVTKPSVKRKASTGVWPQEKKGKKGDYEKEKIITSLDEPEVYERDELKAKYKHKAKEKSVDSNDEKTKTKSSKQKSPKETSDTESSATKSGNEEMVSSPFHSKTRETIAQYTQSKSEMKGGGISRKEKSIKRRHESAASATDDGKVSGKPAHKSKSKSEIEFESFSGNSDEVSEDVHLECTGKATHVKPSITCMERKISLIKDLNLEKEKRSGKARHMSAKKYECVSPCLMKEKERKRPVKVSDKANPLGTKKIKPPKESGVERQSLSKKVEKVAAQLSDTSDSDSSQNDSEDEESYFSDVSSERERDSEEMPSNEEEETEPTTSEDEVKKHEKSMLPIGEIRERVVDANFPGGDDQSDAGDRGRDQKVLDSQTQKRRVRKRRERSMSPIARVSSSPSTSQEENRTKLGPQKKKRKISYKRKRRKEVKSLPNCSGTDDSSPACDMIESQADKANEPTNNIFERFYGKLCCAIINPEDIAAELLNKGLISKSAMKDIFKSPESKQVKTVNLVDTLDEKIKCHPESLFVCIEVLLKNEALQKVGRDMLREAGMDSITVGPIPFNRISHL